MLLKISDIVSRAKTDVKSLCTKSGEEKKANDLTPTYCFKNSLAQELSKLASILRDGDLDPCNVTFKEVEAFASQFKE